MTAIASATIELRIRPDGVSPLVYGVLVTSGEIRAGHTLIAPNGERATIIAVQGPLREEWSVAGEGSRPVLVTSPALDIEEGEAVEIEGSL